MAKNIKCVEPYDRQRNAQMHVTHLRYLIDRFLVKKRIFLLSMTHFTQSIEKQQEVLTA